MEPFYLQVQSFVLKVALLTVVTVTTNAEINFRALQPREVIKQSGPLLRQLNY